MSVTPRASLLVFPDATATRPLAVRVQANRADVAGELAPESARAAGPPSRSSAPFTLAHKGDEVELTFRVHPPRGEVASHRCACIATVDGQRVSRALEHVEYAHIPIQTVTPEADVKLVRADIRHKRTRIGYIAGAGDEVPAALRQAGYEVTHADARRRWRTARSRPIRRSSTGVRAFNVDARLPFVHDRLMKYVADGGTLVVQYNTQNCISSVPAQMGPGRSTSRSTASPTRTPR